MRSFWNVGATYGVFLAVAMFGFLLVLPHPLGAHVFFSIITAQLLAGAWLVWSRTRLPWATGSMIAAAAGSGIFAVFGISPFHSQSHSLYALIGCLAAVVAAGVLDYIQARTDPSARDAWRKHMESCTLIDLLLGRHIPNLRGR